MSAPLTKYQRLVACVGRGFSALELEILILTFNGENEAMGSGCTLSAGSYAEKTGVDRTTIQRNLKRLEADGAIRRRQSMGKIASEIWIGEPVAELAARPKSIRQRRHSSDANRCILDAAVGGEAPEAQPLQIGVANRCTHGAAQYITETLEGDGPPQGAPSTSAPSSAVVDLRTEPSELPPVGAVETGTALRADPVPGDGDPETPAAADPSQKIDAMGSERFTSEPLPSASAPSIDEGDDEDLDDLDEDNPALERFRRENDGDYPADTGELQRFAEAHGIAVTHADRAELRRTLKWIADADRISEDEDDELAIRPVDDDDLRRLRAGVGIDRFGRKIRLQPRDGSALRMLEDEARRADFVGRVNDAAGRLARGGPRRDYWSARLAELKAGLHREAVPPALRHSLLSRLSLEVGAEMVRREDETSKLLREAVA